MNALPSRTTNRSRRSIGLYYSYGLDNAESCLDRRGPALASQRQAGSRPSLVSRSLRVARTAPARRRRCFDAP
jgi:hypothetical protein